MTPTESEAPTTAGRVLLDESVPHDLLLHLTDIDVVTVQELGWAGTKNGALLRVAREAGIQVLVTVDRRIEYQQNIPKSGVALCGRLSELSPFEVGADRRPVMIAPRRLD